MDLKSAAAVYAIFMTFVMLGLSLATYRRYARKDSSKATMAIVLTAWTISLSVAYLLPIDLYPDAAAFVQATSVWAFIYWFCFVGTWIIFPVQQGYETSGYFTFGSKLWDSVWQNLLFYVVAGALFVALIIYVSLSRKIAFADIQDFLMILSNFWGMSLYVMLLGYGLVEIPREFWKAAGQAFNHRTLFYDAQKTYTSFEEAMDRIVESSRALKILQQRIDKENPANADTLKSYVAVIEGLMPKELFEYHRASREESKFVESMKDCTLNVHAFAKIHFRVKADLVETRRSRFHFENVYDQISEHLPEGNEDPDEAVIEVHSGPNATVLRIFWKTISVITGLMSVLVIWSEITTASTKSLSPFGLLLNAVKDNFGALQFFGCMWVFYLCLCSFYALFSLRLGKIYSLHPDQHSEEYSLLFNANFLVRLIFPLGLNFLQMIKFDYKTDYEVAVSSMEIVGNSAEKFAKVFFPVLILLFSTVTYFNVIGKILRAIGVSSFDPQVSKGVDVEIAEGKALIKRERRTRLNKDRQSARPSTALHGDRL